MSTLASILICTRDRLPDLRETLASVGALAVPPGLAAELVVVDNGSSDGTAAWVRRVSLPNMPVRLVEEPRPGVGFARTTALRTARGEIILFTDDDVRLPADWLAAMCAPILAGEADVVGGASVLAEHLQRPWMTGFHRAALSSSEDRSPEDRPAPITISMAFHRRVLARVPAFDPELGPGSRCGAIEDVLFTSQLEEAGCRFARVTGAPVVHHAGVSRLTRRAFLSAARRRGRSTAYLRYHWHHWTEAQFTHRKRRWEVWRHPYAVLVKRWLHLWFWRITHPGAWRRSEGIAPEEFAFVNLWWQMRQYLVERKRPRNYERRGLVKRRGLLPDAAAKDAGGRTVAARRIPAPEG
jgi:glycosyltransferase involved in cell wall biosynthesis